MRRNEAKNDWSTFFPIHEKSVLFAWMCFPLLVIAVIYISFTNDYVQHIRIYNYCTAPLYFAIAIWLNYSFMTAPCVKKRDKHYYSKPIAMVLNVTLWGSIIGRLALLTLKVFCYDTGLCHHPVTDAKSVWELAGGMLDDLTDITVLLTLFLYIRHTIKHDFIDPDRNKFVFQKHIILAVLVLLFFQIASQELHELIVEKDHLRQKQKDHTSAESSDSAQSLDGQIQNTIEFLAPFTFLLSTELIGLLFGLALVLDVGNDSTPAASIISLNHTLKRFMAPADPCNSILKKQRCHSTAVPFPDLNFLQPPTVASVQRSNSSPGIPESLKVHARFQQPEKAPEITRWQSDGNLEEEPTARQSVSQEDISGDPPAYDFARRTLRTRASLRRDSSRGRSGAVSWLIIILSVTLAMAEFCEFAQKTYLYGRFHTSQITINNTSPLRNNATTATTESSGNVTFSGSTTLNVTETVTPPVATTQKTEEVHSRSKRRVGSLLMEKMRPISVIKPSQLASHDDTGSSTPVTQCNATEPNQTTYMGSDRQISDLFNAGTNIWASILYLVMIYKILDGLNQGDYVELPPNDHSKIDKLFLFFTATLWSIAIGIYTSADFLKGTQFDCTHSYELTTFQQWSGLISQLSMFVEIWLQLILLQIQLSIALPRKVTASSRLHHWAHIIALHSILLLDLVEWFSFFFEQQFTKYLLPFYPSDLLIPTRLLTPYIGMYLFHAICCWMIVRVNFKKKSYFQLGSEVSLS